MLHHTHDTIGQLPPESQLVSEVRLTIASIIVVDENGPKPEPVRSTTCRLEGSAGSVLFGNIEMFEFNADRAGTTYENADETDAVERRWPTETKIVYPGQRSDCVKMKTKQEENHK